MNTASRNNLWNYLQGLSLSAADRNWLAEKLVSNPPATNKKPASTVKHGYKFSPTVKELMGSVHIDPKDIENDDRLRYILSK